MQKLGLKHLLQQKLSPQQIQFIKLLQLSTTELESRVEEEIEDNPALDEGHEISEDEYDEQEVDNSSDDELDISEYLKHDDVANYKTKSNNYSDDDEDSEMPIIAKSSVFDNLKTQLGYLKLDEENYTIAMQLVGSIDQDGYIRRDLMAIVNDLAFTQNIDTNEDELGKILKMIHQFEPAGIGARNLQECLLLQLERRNESPALSIAEEIVEHHFEEFTKKHYSKIISKLEINEDELKSALEIITKLNPKPGGSSSNSSTRTAQILTADFTVEENNGGLKVSLNSRNAPELHVSNSYIEMLDSYDKGDKKDKSTKEAATFVKQKLDSAKWFIDAVKQRQHTLLNTMNAIVEYQKDFFLDGDESSLKPMILKDIAEKIEMDISTISRVTNSKAVQTEFGLFPLKYFFSEGISTSSGEEVSSREVKQVLKQIIDGESKIKPLSDEKIAELINEKGYNLARRTVAKYREQLNIPVARLRKEL